MLNILKSYRLSNINYIKKSYLTGGEIIYKKLIENNVKDVFLYSGGAIMPLVDAFYKGTIKYYINSHEQNTGHAATGYAKSTNNTGVCVVTSGPGLTNMITPILDATNDSTPLVVFSGQVPLNAIGTNAFQECPAVDITKYITKWSYCVKNVSELPHVVDAAFKIANDRKKGAVHIDLPKCIIASNYIENKLYNKLYYISKYFKDNNFTYNNIFQIEPDNLDIINKIQKIAYIINNSNKPVLYIGKGCNNYSNLLKILANKGNIPVTTTIHAVGVFDEHDPLSLEFLGMHGNVAANYSIQNSDCIIAIGSRFDDRTIGNIEKYAPYAKKASLQKKGGIIHINIEPNEINKVINTDYNISIDSGVFMTYLLPLIKYKDRCSWTSQYTQWKLDYPFQITKTNIEKHSKIIKTQDVISEINNQLISNKIDNKTIITTGVGNHQMMTAQFIKWRYPKTLITSGSLGVMGAGLPYAIGAQIANPDKIVIDIDGDGSFNHTLSDLITIVNYKLPVKIAIMNDGHHSMVRVWEELFYNKKYTATTLNNNPNYKKLAKSFGIHSISCDNISNLKNTINYFLNYKGAILCDFKVKTDKCLPLVSPGKALDELILHKNFDNKVNNENFKQSLPPS